MDAPLSGDEHVQRVLAAWNKSRHSLNEDKADRHRHELIETIRALATDGETGAQMRHLVRTTACKHVGVFVVTTAGRLLVQRIKKGVQAFGGCNYDNSILRMMNSLRLELMDECSLTFGSPGFVRASPLMLLCTAKDCTLLQVLLWDDATIAILKDRVLWSAEHSRKFFQKNTVPHGWCNIDEIPQAVHYAGQKCLEFRHLNQAESWRTHFRKCDWIALQAVQPWIAALQQGPVDDAIQLLVASGTDVAEKKTAARLDALRHLQNSFNALPRLRSLSVGHWDPLLWKQAEILEERAAQRIWLGHH